LHKADRFVIPLWANRSGRVVGVLDPFSSTRNDLSTIWKN
jgi:hypothetical protein